MFHKIQESIGASLARFRELSVPQSAYRMRLKRRKVAKEKSQARARVIAAERKAHFQLPAS